MQSTGSLGKPEGGAIFSGIVRQRAQAQLEEAMLLVAPSRKQYYMEAVRRCPFLVQTESDPIRFLLFAKFNSWSAAERLAAYWGKRHAIFRDRAFLPLDLSGKGALSNEAIESLKRGVYVFTSDDTVVIDRNLEDESVSEDVASQRTFFIMHVMMKAETAQIQGQGIHMVMRGYRQQQRHVINVTTDLAFNTFPLHLKIIHIVMMNEDKQTIMQSIIPYIIQRLGPLSTFLKIHNCDSAVDVLQKLAEHGTLPSMLPITMGGTFDTSTEFVRFLVQHGLPISISSFKGVLGADQTAATAILNTFLEGTAMPVQVDHLDQVTAAVQTATGTASTRIDYSHVMEMPVILEREVSRLNESIRLMPDEDKAAYLEAIRRVPQLVETETNPIDFLKYHKFDTWAAARRLLAYWRTRCLVFEDRAFLPMTSSGSFDAEAKRAFQSGIAFILPEYANGLSVMLYNASKNKGWTVKTRLQIAFYCGHQIIRNPKSITDGFVIMMLFGDNSYNTVAESSASSQNNWSSNGKIVADTFLECVPTCVTTTHVVYGPDSKRSFFSSIFPIALKVYSKAFESNVYCHVDDDESGILCKLEPFGFSAQNLPKELGGELEIESLISTCIKGKPAAKYPEQLNLLPGTEIETGTSCTTKLAIQKMKDSLEALPFEDKVALMEAIAKVPQLVEKESDYGRFLRFNSYDPSASARMLARYWQTRQSIFGERAMLPLDQTGDGALGRKDLTVLQSGYLTQLPCDQNGNSVLCCDGTRLQKSTRESRLRCTFYMLSVVSENELSQTEGYSFLYFVTEPSFDRASKECFDQVLPVIPAKMKQFYLLGVPPEGTSEDEFMDGQVKDTSDALKESVFQLTSTHVGSCRSDLARSLEQCGFVVDKLPKSLCGQWGVEEFVKWQELRVRYEWELCIGSEAKETAASYCIPLIKAAPEKNESERTERKRRMNVIHSRRKRERERIEIEILQERAMELKERKDRLRQEGKQLVHLLKKAEALLEL